MVKKKKILIVILLLLIIIFIILASIVFKKVYSKIVFENETELFASKNQEKIFSINKCVLFSNCNAKNNTSSKTNFTLENLYQYTDIALFINNNSDENSLENTLKSVKICNLNYTQTPELRNAKNLL